MHGSAMHHLHGVSALPHLRADWPTNVFVHLRVVGTWPATSACFRHPAQAETPLAGCTVEHLRAAINPLRHACTTWPTNAFTLLRAHETNIAALDGRRRPAPCQTRHARQRHAAPARGEGPTPSARRQIRKRLQTSARRTRLACNICLL